MIGKFAIHPTIIKHFEELSFKQKNAYWSERHMLELKLIRTKFPRMVTSLLKLETFIEVVCPLVNTTTSLR